MANNRICLTCGKAYEYCSSCSSSLDSPVWKNMFCTENCKVIFETASDYAQKVITKESAKNKISKCDLSHYEKYNANISRIINDITFEEVIKEDIQESQEISDNQVSTEDLKTVVDPMINKKRKRINTQE